MTLSYDEVRALLDSLRFTRDREMTCDEWLEDVADFLETPPSERQSDAFRLVREHLDLCADCREEIGMMVKALELQGQDRNRRNDDTT